MIRPPSRISCLLLLALSLAVLVAACADDKGSSCQSDIDRIQLCNRRVAPTLCETDEGRCLADCYAKLSCNEYFAIDDGHPPGWFTQCVTPCSERYECKNGESTLMRWQCDGSEDCSDGSDEQRCKYFVCKDGQRVRETAKCDGDVECGDESDEVGCP